ncbi:hypothetical protein [Shewanella kaireitica]|uniref:hypothetical protein n=1 Tax=Shewanella kaireitica TaxID=212021 RepID=UPI0020109C56|nr:hypothetical protein [Shewanella kaireitica]MCL1094867.1 hypothetical protein [Shewanella kaireitica]
MNKLLGIKGSFVTKLEFAEKLEKYQKKQIRSKWEHFIWGIVLIAFAFFPSIVPFLNGNSYHIISTAFAILAGLSLRKAWDIKRGTEEHELLIDALELIKAKSDT